MRKLQGVKLINTYYMDRFSWVRVNQEPNARCLLERLMAGDHAFLKLGLAWVL